MESNFALKDKHRFSIDLSVVAITLSNYVLHTYRAQNVPRQKMVKQYANHCDIGHSRFGGIPHHVVLRIALIVISVSAQKEIELICFISRFEGIGYIRCCY